MTLGYLNIAQDVMQFRLLKQRNEFFVREGHQIPCEILLHKMA